MKTNYMEVKFKAVSENESFARTCVASFCLQLSPNINELNDIKTAVSEAVTNAVVHAYPNKIGDITVRAEIYGNLVTVIVSDEGVGIEDFSKAREPFYTTKPEEERSGMGFAIMESFMDNLVLRKNNGKGLCVVLTKKISEKRSLVGEECSCLQRL